MQSNDLSFYEIKYLLFAIIICDLISIKITDLLMVTMFMLLLFLTNTITRFIFTIIIIEFQSLTHQMFKKKILPKVNR